MATMKLFYYLALIIKVAIATTTCDEVSCTSIHNGASCTFSISQRCNGEVDCSELGFDEANCTYVCINSLSLCSSEECYFVRSNLCDGIAQCPDRVDETDCDDTLITPIPTISTTACRGFRCDDGTCLPFNIRCDGFYQCPDRTDELGCPTPTTPPTTDCNGFTCDNGQCIPSAFYCDGLLHDCSDGSDERNCIFTTAITVPRPSTSSNNEEYLEAIVPVSVIVIGLLILFIYAVYKSIKILFCKNSSTQRPPRPPRPDPYILSPWQTTRNLVQQPQRSRQQQHRQNWPNLAERNAANQQRSRQQQNRQNWPNLAERNAANQQRSRQQQHRQNWPNLAERNAANQQRSRQQQHRQNWPNLAERNAANQQRSRQQQHRQNWPNLAERTAADVTRSNAENLTPYVVPTVVVQDLEAHSESELLEAAPPNYESSVLYPKANVDEEPPSYESISETALTP